MNAGGGGGIWHYARMPRYHFDVSRDGEPWSDDDEGTELAGPQDARREAVHLAHALAKARPASELSIRVRNGDPTPLLTVRVATSVEGRS